ncbi:MAG: D-alanine--D-alanine ligase [Bacteroidetes bacterium]|nr:D-alanine--D-alanine ligase [Bacteroidota bacterium]
MNEHILLIFGGKSAEHEISCISAASIYKALTDIEYTVTCVGVTLNNCMYLQEPVIRYDKKTSSEFIAIQENETNSVALHPGKGFFCNGAKLSIDIIFPIIHGNFGEDGRLQGLFDFLPIPYIGCNFFSSCLGFSKYTAKLYWERSNLPVVPYLVVNDYAYNFNFSKEPVNFEKSTYFSKLVADIENKLTYPIFIKPENSGSSIGVSKVLHPKDIHKAIVLAAKASNRILIEQAVIGRELEFSVLGRNKDFYISEPGEIITDQQFYTFEAKYSSNRDTTKIQVPAFLPHALITEAKELAHLAFTSLLCKGFARIDMLYESKNNKLYLNEINTLPGFTESSMFIKLIENGGLSWRTLMKKLIKFAMEEFKENQN